MQIKNTRKLKKAIEIKIDDLEKLENIISEYYKYVRYKVDLINNSNIEFDDFDELKGFNNVNDRKITAMRIIAGSRDFSSEIEISIMNRGGFIFAFSDTIVVEYRFSNDNEEIIFINRLDEFFETIKQNRVISLCSKISFNMISFLGGALIIALMITGNWDLSKNRNLIIASIIIVWGAILLEKAWRYLFPPIVILIGQEEKRNELRNKLRTTVFITVGLGTVVSIFATIICNFFS